MSLEEQLSKNTDALHRLADLLEDGVVPSFAKSKNEAVISSAKEGDLGAVRSTIEEPKKRGPKPKVKETQTASAPAKSGPDLTSDNYSKIKHLVVDVPPNDNGRLQQLLTENYQVDNFRVLDASLYPDVIRDLPVWTEIIRQEIAQRAADDATEASFV